MPRLARKANPNVKLVSQTNRGRRGGDPLGTFFQFAALISSLSFEFEVRSCSQLGHGTVLVGLPLRWRARRPLRSPLWSDTSRGGMKKIRRRNTNEARGTRNSTSRCRALPTRSDSATFGGFPTCASKTAEVSEWMGIFHALNVQGRMNVCTFVHILKRGETRA